MMTHAEECNTKEKQKKMNNKQMNGSHHIYFSSFRPFFYLDCVLHIFGNKSSVDIIFHNRIIRSITPTRMKKNTNTLVFGFINICVSYRMVLYSYRDLRQRMTLLRPVCENMLPFDCSWLYDWIEIFVCKIIISNKIIAVEWQFETNLAVIWLITQMITLFEKNTFSRR